MCTLAYKPTLVCCIYECMLSCMYVYGGVCDRYVRAYVCVLSYTNVQVHTCDFSWACKRACVRLHACLLICMFARSCKCAHR